MTRRQVPVVGSSVLGCCGGRPNCWPKVRECDGKLPTPSHGHVNIARRFLLCECARAGCFLDCLFFCSWFWVRGGGWAELEFAAIRVHVRWRPSRSYANVSRRAHTTGRLPETSFGSQRPHPATALMNYPYFYFQVQTFLEILGLRSGTVCFDSHARLPVHQPPTITTNILSRDD